MWLGCEKPYEDPEPTPNETESTGGTAEMYHCA